MRSLRQVTPGPASALHLEPRQIGERIRDLFETELRAEAWEWELNGSIPRNVFERLGGLGAFEARWPKGGRDTGEVIIGSLLVRETALASVGGCIAIGTHLEVYFRAIARSEYGGRVWQDALEGKALGALAVSEFAGGSNPANCETSAQRSGDGWLLNGHKHYVSNAPAATDVIVFARTSRKRELSDYTMFLVARDAPGVSIVPHNLVAARAAGTCTVALRDVYVEDERRVGSVGSGMALVIEFLRGERLGAASGCLAIAELCLEVALVWVEQRRSGGERLRQKQTLVHRLAMLATEIEAARAFLCDRIATAQDGRITSAEAAQAKLVTSRLAWRAADETMQILGGHGFTEETPFAQLWRDIRIGRIGGGTDEVQLELIGRSLRRGDLAGHGLVKAVELAADGP
jgi:alkylation response protein AidB-like acyl-CoA dehydrogenase